MKRVLISMITVFVLLFSTAVPTFAADTAKATTLRIAGTTGTVTVKNAAGKAQTVKNDMRLYNGYVISTGKSSEAYISLDGTKAVKLGASGKVALAKSGNKLELSVKSGKLYFNVTAPLKSTESLNIRTSTMVTGVRGSFGWVEDGSVGLVHGHVVVDYDDPAKNESGNYEIFSGQGVGDSVGSEEGNEYGVWTIKNEDIPSIVIEEIAKDPELQKQITEDVENLSVDEIIANEETKKAEEAAEEEAREAEEAARAAEEAENAGRPEGFSLWDEIRKNIYEAIKEAVESAMGRNTEAPVAVSTASGGGGSRSSSSTPEKINITLASGENLPYTLGIASLESLIEAGTITTSEGENKTAIYTMDAGTGFDIVIYPDSGYDLFNRGGDKEEDAQVFLAGEEIKATRSAAPQRPSTSGSSGTSGDVSGDNPSASPTDPTGDTGDDAIKPDGGGTGDNTGSASYPAASDEYGIYYSIAPTKSGEITIEGIYLRDYTNKFVFESGDGYVFRPVEKELVEADENNADDENEPKEYTLKLGEGALTGVYLPTKQNEEDAEEDWELYFALEVKEGYTVQEDLLYLYLDTGSDDTYKAIELSQYASEEETDPIFEPSDDGSVFYVYRISEDTLTKNDDGETTETEAIKLIDSTGTISVYSGIFYNLNSSAAPVEMASFDDTLKKAFADHKYVAFNIEKGGEAVNFNVPERKELYLTSSVEDGISFKDVTVDGRLHIAQAQKATEGEDDGESVEYIDSVISMDSLVVSEGGNFALLPGAKLYIADTLKNSGSLNANYSVDGNESTSQALVFAGDNPDKLQLRGESEDSYWSGTLYHTESRFTGTVSESTKFVRVQRLRVVYAANDVSDLSVSTEDSNSELLMSVKSSDNYVFKYPESDDVKNITVAVTFTWLENSSNPKIMLDTEDKSSTFKNSSLNLYKGNVYINRGENTTLRIERYTTSGDTPNTPGGNTVPDGQGGDVTDLDGRG